MKGIGFQRAQPTSENRLQVPLSSTAWDNGPHFLLFLSLRPFSQVVRPYLDGIPSFDIPGFFWGCLMMKSKQSSPPFLHAISIPTCISWVHPDAQQDMVSLTDFWTGNLALVFMLQAFPLHYSL